MPVLATLSAIALLRNSSQPQPFFDPDLLRELLADGLSDAPDDTLAESMALAVDLKSVVERYRVSVDSGIDAYINASQGPGANKESLSRIFAVVDQERSKALNRIVRIRQRLVDVLDEQQWKAVFG